LRHSSRRRARSSTSTPDFGGSGRMSAKFAQSPASGAQLAVDFHRKDEKPVDDLLLDLGSMAPIAS
jgi:hypothetical protein